MVYLNRWGLLFMDLAQLHVSRGYLTSLLPNILRSGMVILAGLAIFAGLANAQCPAVGADATCGVVITVIQTGNAPCPSQGCASISFTGQGPYDQIEDTLVGLVNKSKLPIASVVLNSGLNIFGFEADGICGLDPFTGQPFIPAPAGCPFGPTSYEGPGVSFSNIDPTTTTGTVHFNPPIAPGGTAYFSLEESLTQATACSSVINGSVPKPLSGGTEIRATFTPNLGYTLGQAAQLCGFTGWDWQQTITSLPLPSPFHAAGSTTPLHAPPAFNDPPPQGYAYQNPPNAVLLPIYYNVFAPASNPLSLAANETSSQLAFFDAPADSCLHGGTGAVCGGKTAPAGSKLGFTTHLVGLVGLGPGYGIQDTGVGFSWTDTFNGTSGGISVINSSQGVDPGSGTGAITVTNFNDVTSYQYPKGLGVSAINGVPVSQSSGATSTLLTGAQVSVLASGLAYSRVNQTFIGTLTITNISSSTIDGPFQLVLDSLTPGVALANATNTFGGWSYVTISSQGSLAPGQSANVNLQFKDPSNSTINFTPLVYSGGFN
jgi:hypothetical protein